MTLRSSSGNTGPHSDPARASLTHHSSGEPFREAAAFLQDEAAGNGFGRSSRSAATKGAPVTKTRWLASVAIVLAGASPGAFAGRGGGAPARVPILANLNPPGEKLTLTQQLPINLVFIGLLPATVTDLAVLRKIVPGATAPLPASPRQIDERKMRAPMQLPAYLDTLSSRSRQGDLELTGLLTPNPDKYMGAAFEYQYNIIYDVGHLQGRPSARDDLARQIIDHSFFYPSDHHLRSSIGFPCRSGAPFNDQVTARITTQQYYYSECQTSRVHPIKAATAGAPTIDNIDVNYHVDATYLEDWLNQEVLEGSYSFVDARGEPARPIRGAYTVFLLSTYDSDDFTFHTYYYKDEPDPDMCVDSGTQAVVPCATAAPGSPHYAWGLIRDSRQSIRWGDDPGSRSVFYDVSAGPDHFTQGGYLPDNAYVSYAYPQYFYPAQLAIWEYGRNDGSPYARAYYQANWWGWSEPLYPDLSLDLANAVRYGCIYFDFTHSPVYDPILTLPSGKEEDLFTDIRLTNHLFDAIPGFDGRWVFDIDRVAREEQKLLPLSRVSAVLADHTDPHDPLYFDPGRAETLCAHPGPYPAKEYQDVPIEAAYCGFNSFFTNYPGQSAYGTRQPIEYLDPHTWQLSTIGLAYGDLPLFVMDHPRQILGPWGDREGNRAGDGDHVDKRVPLLVFNTVGSATNPALLGLAQQDPRTHDQQSQLVMQSPLYYSLGAGVTGVAIHENGHYFGMSHRHDGYDWEYDQFCDQYCRQPPGSATDPKVYAECRINFCGTGQLGITTGILNSGDETHSAMTYLDNARSFGQTDFDNHNRWLAVSFMNLANFVWGRIVAHPERAAAAGALAEAADAEIGTMIREYAKMKYGAAAGHARDAYALMIRAARVARVEIDPKDWRGYHQFPLDFFLNTPIYLDQADRADDHLLAEGADLSQADALEALSVGAGSLPVAGRAPGPLADLALDDANATVVELRPSSARGARRPAVPAWPGSGPRGAHRPSRTR